MSKFTRDDIKDFITNFQKASWSDEKNGVMLLNECGCEDSAYGLNSGVDYDPSMAALPELFAMKQHELSSHPPCPDSYSKTVDFVVQIPHEVIEMLMPAMEEIGVGCPASLATAVGDVLTVAQENEITPVFRVSENKVNERFQPRAAGDADRNLRQAVLAFVDQYMGGMEMDPSDAGDVRRTKQKIMDVVSSVLG